MDNKNDHLVSRRTWDFTQSLEYNLRATPEALDRYVNIVPHEITAYPKWSQIGLDQWIRFGAGNTFGIILLISTCGPAVFVMYMSQPIVSTFSSQPPFSLLN